MIPLAEITGEKNSDAQTKYNRRIPLSQIVGDTAPQAEPEKTGDGFWDTAGNAFDWWKNNSLAGAGFLGGLLAETTGNVAESLGKEFPENSWRRNLLESAGNLAQDAADTMLDYGTKKVYTANGDNFGGAFANQ
ncbi:MAG: hypothetical protein IJG32_05485, partial [Selenomonadaceae bacterium]|nr:hypothetical protein [Selenomonadaceae bacterium]